MIQSRPKLKSKKLIVISLLLLILAVLLFPVANFAGNFAVIIHIFAIASAAVSLFILIKYVIPDYLYTLEYGHFRIHKVTKSQSVCVADIELNTVTSKLMTEDEYKAQNRSAKIFKYLKNPNDEDVRYFLFSIDGELLAIQFEPDERFINAFNNALENINYEEEDE